MRGVAPDPTRGCPPLDPDQGRAPGPVIASTALRAADALGVVSPVHSRELALSPAHAGRPPVHTGPATRLTPPRTISPDRNTKRVHVEDPVG